MLDGSTACRRRGPDTAIPPIFTITGMVLCGANSERNRRAASACSESRRSAGHHGLGCNSKKTSDGLILIAMGVFTDTAFFWAFCTPQDEQRVNGTAWRERG